MDALGTITFANIAERDIASFVRELLRVANYSAVSRNRALFLQSVTRYGKRSTSFIAQSDRSYENEEDRSSQDLMKISPAKYFHCVLQRRQRGNSTSSTFARSPSANLEVIETFLDALIGICQNTARTVTRSFARSPLCAGSTCSKMLLNVANRSDR